MIRFSKLSIAAATVAMMATVTIWGEQPTLAQGPFRGGRPSIAVQAFNACTTTNYADIIAKALNLKTADLRKDIVSGQALQDIATTANIPFQTVTDAFQTVRKADIDQAVTDGVLTQADATTMEATPNAVGTRPAPDPNRTPGGPRGPRGPQANLPNVQFPDISTINVLLLQMAGTQPVPGTGPRGGGGFGGPGGGFGGGIGLAIGGGTFNVVKQYAVAAQALNIKCADLVKTLITPPGKSIVNVAADQKIDPQTVTDALTKAYKDALAQDVTDGIITQAQSDQLTANLDKTIATFINNPLPMGPQATQQAQ